MLDRIDIHIEVPSVSFQELSASTESGEPSSSIRERVASARIRQKERYKSSITTNATMTPRQQRSCCELDDESRSLLEHAMQELHFSARAHDRILKVARTLADLAGSDAIRADDILEAIQFRSLDRKLFA